MALTCKKCGKEVPEENKFCVHCGAPMNGEEPQNETNAAAENQAQTATNESMPNQAQNFQNPNNMGQPQMGFVQYQKPNYEQMLVDSDEEIVAEANELIVPGKPVNAGSEMLFLSNKRLYNFTSKFSFRKGINKRTKIIKNDNITSTDMVTRNPVQYLALGIICGIIAILAIMHYFEIWNHISALQDVFEEYSDKIEKTNSDVYEAAKGVAGFLTMEGIYSILKIVAFVAAAAGFIVRYLMIKGTYIVITYAGGSYEINTKKYDFNSVVSLRRELNRRVK